MNWCDVADELDLPEAHRLLLGTPKSGEYGMLGAMFIERTLACGLSLTQVSALCWRSTLRPTSAGSVA